MGSSVETKQNKELKELRKLLDQKTRELQIEAALERVRSRTMAMNDSDELRKVVTIIYQELEKLGFKIRQCVITILNDREKFVEWWSTGMEDKILPKSYIISYNNPYISKKLQEIKNQIRDNTKYQEQELKGKNKEMFDEVLFTHTDLKNLPEEVKKEMASVPRIFISDAFMKYGMIEVVGTEPLDAENTISLQRFAKVFEQTYTRFLDLQKAEAQAREAQIEAALERVRAQAMALHRSEDLKGVIAILYHQLTELGLDLYDANIVIEDETGALTFWGSGLGGVEMPPKFTMPHQKSKVIQKVYYNWDKQDQFHQYLLKGKELQSFFKIVLTKTEFKDAPEEYLNEMTSVDQVCLSHVAINHGMLEVASDQLLPDDHIEIIKRFGAVVDLTYTRFDDLLKAEKQKREAQIEAALERVRASSMAMHQSNELVEVVRRISKEISDLGIFVHYTQIFTDWKDDLAGGLNAWVAVDGIDYLQKMHIPFMDHPVFTNNLDAMAGGLDFTTEKFTKSEKNSFFRWAFKYSDLKNVPNERKDKVLNYPGWTRATVILKNSMLQLSRYNLDEFNEEEEKIFKRFGKVFEQAYTRFLDLQKAEEQAREAQIEAALERVRSRTMGMQKSEELLELAVLLHKELLNLGVTKFLDCGYVEVDEANKTQHVWMTDAVGDTFEKYNIPLIGDDILQTRYQNWKKQVPVFYQEISGDKRKNHLDFVLQQINSEQAKELARAHFPNPVYFYCANFSHGYIHIIGGSQLTVDEEALLVRFSKTFEHTYKRFLDLKKAEEQAREAQIEAALERVRASSMAMHTSNDLLKVIQTVTRQLLELNIQFDNATFAKYEEKKYMDLWISTPAQTYPAKVRVPYFDHPIFDFKQVEDVPDGFISLTYSKKEKDIFFKKFFELDEVKNIPANRIKYVLDSEGLSRSVFRLKGILLSVAKYNLQLFTEEENNIFQRFANVFEQAYTRFIDLQKAEAQTRESEIQLALERVRARTMAMHKSDELPETASLLFQEMKKLEEIPDRIGIVTYNEEKKAFQNWVTDQNGMQITDVHYASIDEPTTFNKIFQSWKNNEESLIIDLSGTELEEWLQYVKNELHLYVDKSHIKNRRVHYIAFFSYGFLMCTYHEPLKHNFIDLFVRFAKVFEQTYTRFLDLQKAEAQAREAQVEAALERVRASSMAMHESKDLYKIVNEVLTEMKELEMSMSSVMVHEYLNDTKDMYFWAAAPGMDYPEIVYLPYKNSSFFNRFLEARQNSEDFFTDVTSKKEHDSNWAHYFKYNKVPEERQAYLLSNPGMTRSSALFNNTAITMLRYDKTPFLKEENKILIRFGQVFEQAYTRFLDLQKAEKQARESEIEASLERVRSASMAMHKSDEMVNVVRILDTQLHKLGIETNGSQLITDYADIERGLNCWVAVLEQEYLEKFHSPYFDHPIIMNLIKAVERGIDFYTEKYSKVEKNRFFKLLFKNSDFKRLSKERQEFIYNTSGYVRAVAVFKNSVLILQRYNHKEFTEEEKIVIKRFGKVFEQTYTRFLDLQRAEAQAREAIKQASLDRIRGEIASMRNSQDLNRITPVIWRELQALEVSFIRCGVFIIDEEKQKVNVYLTTPDGKPLGVLNLHSDANELTKNTLEHWKKKRIFRTHWNKTEFINWTKSMMKLGQVQSAETYQGAASAPESLNLHFVPFKQGMLYVGDVAPLSDDHIELVKTLAEAFSIAYARYEDFKTLEEAKNKIENTLTELKAAQNQLIQAEKMASLGELTAGIAHEIQNPLNFVNNFSEVNSELLDDLKDAIANNDQEEMEALFKDLKENESKIMNHGKRAESIVKGMLLHSRGSSGQKEPTDINALCDEYLRLSYHGFRAKDKSFSADFKFKADEKLPKLNVVPQDIGRVLLNLINNAFYVVNEKAKSPLTTQGGTSENLKEYKPQVIVNTSVKPPFGGMGGQIEITVKDNGPGIPAKVKEKIFQPFFTTKPTGEGTGLGLSLSYDIIKAHGGELKVETREGSGTEFIIQLLI